MRRWLIAWGLPVAGGLCLAVAIGIAGWLDVAPLPNYGLGLVGLVMLIIWFVWKVPKWQSRRWPRYMPLDDRIELEDKARATVVSLVSGLGLVAVATLTLSQLVDTREAVNESADLARIGQLVDRFDSAITDIGASDPHGRPIIELRLGGISLLYQFVLSAKTPGARDTVTEVLAAYIRENAPVRRKLDPTVTAGVTQPCKASGGSVRSDIQAAIDVLQKLHPVVSPLPPPFLEERKEPLHLDLSGADLSGADLSNLNLDSADLAGARLFNANLTNSSLYGVTLGPSRRSICLLRKGRPRHRSDQESHGPEPRKLRGIVYHWHLFRPHDGSRRHKADAP